MISKKTLIFYFLLIFGNVMGQNNEDNIYQPIQLAKIYDDKVSSVLFKNYENNEDNLKLIIYPNLDSIKTLTIKEFSNNLPNKIIFFLCIKQDGNVKINNVKAIYDSSTVDLNIKYYNYMNMFVLNKGYNQIKKDSLEFNISIKIDNIK